MMDAERVVRQKKGDLYRLALARADMRGAMEGCDFLLAEGIKAGRQALSGAPRWNHRRGTSSLNLPPEPGGHTRMLVPVEIAEVDPGATPGQQDPPLRVAETACSDTGRTSG
jgi:hypothetical protein